MGTVVEWRGKRFDPRTAKMLAEVARLTKPLIQPTQGSYSTSVKVSANTHAGGGAVDLRVHGWSGSTITDVVRIMRTVGFAAWHRTPAEGDWPHHIHGIAIGCEDLGENAKKQVASYKNGRNGLKSNKADTGPKVGVTTFEAYLGGRPKQPKAKSVNLDKLRRAAKVDPPGSSSRAEYPAGTKLVEAALVKEGLLSKQFADKVGHFGSKTVEAYAAWQRRCGFKGADADGTPGRVSLEKLGAKHGFSVP